MLYGELQKNPKDRFSFLQTDTSKILGETHTFKAPRNLVGDMLFDVFFVNKLIRKIPTLTIFHAPANILPLWKVRGVKYVVSIMDLSFIRVPHLSGRIFNMYYRHLVGRSLKIADAIIAISENTKKDIVELYGISPDRIHVTYLGIDGAFFEQKVKPRLIKQRYFFSVTTHPKRKNIFSILDALKKSESLDNLHFVLAGHIEPTALEELREYVNRLGLSKRVKLLGYVTQDDLISLYQHADFFIYPSYYEGFGFPPLEAMACKCPVIVSETSSLPELVSDSRWHVNPYDINSIADAMEDMSHLGTTDRNKLIMTNLKFVSKFRWSVTAEQTRKIFTKLLAHS